VSPLVTKLEGKSDIHDLNSNFSTNTSTCEIINYDNTKEFKMEDHGLIFEISKTVILQSLFWTSTHLRKQNTTAFCYRRFFEKTQKKIFFITVVCQLYNYMARTTNTISLLQQNTS